MTDLFLILLLQIGAFAYGLYTIAGARPVWLAFEGDRFRVVQSDDINKAQLINTRGNLSSLSFTGPRLIAVELLPPTDPGFPLSLQLAMQGLHPAFRPERWLPYETQREQLLGNLKPVSQLRKKHVERRGELDLIFEKMGVPEENAGYLPLVRDLTTDWVVIVNRLSGRPMGYLHMDGWGE